jgi:DNA replicative helicase MCM subunit Mcm2 (Cdc46/Mcm family)
MKDFLLNYVDKNLKEEDRIHGKFKYIIELQKIANKKSKLLTIHCEDIDDFFSKDNKIYKSIISNTKRYLKIFYDIAEEIMPTRTSQINSEVIFLSFLGN